MLAKHFKHGRNEMAELLASVALRKRLLPTRESGCRCVALRVEQRASHEGNGSGFALRRPRRAAGSTSTPAQQGVFEPTPLRRADVALDEHVEYLVIATHSREIEGRLFATLPRDRWRLAIERPTISRPP